MSHPLVIVENAVRYFMSQWLNGQQPYLNIKTHINGEIYVRSEVRCAGAKAHSQASLSQRKSGHYSRQRRRSRRSKTAIIQLFHLHVATLQKTLQQFKKPFRTKLFTMLDRLRYMKILIISPSCHWSQSLPISWNLTWQCVFKIRRHLLQRNPNFLLLDLILSRYHLRNQDFLTFLYSQFKIHQYHQKLYSIQR